MIIISIKVQKRQALIPFPRTGKRANLPTIHKMEDSSPVEEIPEYLIGQPIIGSHLVQCAKNFQKSAIIYFN